jgi:hypothetical protein
MLKKATNETLIVSALRARANFGESERKGTNAFTSQKIDRIIKITQAQKRKR